MILHAVHGGDTSTFRPNETRGVGVIHHHQGAKLVRQIADFRQRRIVPIHGEHAVGHDHNSLRPRFARRHQLSAQVRHVPVGIAEPLRLGEANPVN